jgi:uncharacterized protein YndB with AHSA1/START domain
VKPGEPVLVMTRTFAAPRAVVFAQWTVPANLARWWAAHHVLAPDPTVHAGDTFRVRLSTGGAERWVRIAVREVVVPERIVFTWGADEPATETVLTVRFSDEDGATRLTLHQAIARRPTEAHADLAGRLARLGAWLATTPELRAR